MRYFAITLDPLHIGTGGYRLGRVDNTIVRDAAFDLPKVPGTSLAGIVRSYAFYALTDEEDKLLAMECQTNEGNAKGNCGQCKICKIFGYAASETKQASNIGLLHFYDGHIIAMPCRTLLGPVWVGSPFSLWRAGIKINIPEENILHVNFKMDLAGDKLQRLNLGWLYLPTKPMSEDTKKKIQPIADILNKIMKGCKIAIAPDWLFSEIVNSNLETRTSVSIDSKTGAAEEGKLFTYEAIPAAALLAFDIEFDNRRIEDSNMKKEEIDQLLQNSLEQCAILGMGGMVTHGFGRIRFYKEGANYSDQYLTLPTLCL